MGFLWMAFAAGAVLLWAISLGRIFTFPAPTCVPPSPPFLPPLRGDRRSRNVLLVVAHPDDESMYFFSLSFSCIPTLC
jgi:N-acetylglucosaminylphosphatidylinositol deacetylase